MVHRVKRQGIRALYNQRGYALFGQFPESGERSTYPFEPAPLFKLNLNFERFLFDRLLEKMCQLLALFVLFGQFLNNYGRQ